MKYINRFVFICLSALTILVLPEKPYSQKNELNTATATNSWCLDIETPVPKNPYPLKAAGWGPRLLNGFFFIRWVEDWTCLRKTDKALRHKAIPLLSSSSLTLSGEVRLCNLIVHNESINRKNDFEHALLRGILGADLRLNPIYTFIVKSELGKSLVRTIQILQSL